jgi:hypothetical protein
MEVQLSTHTISIYTPGQLVALLVKRAQFARDRAKRADSVRVELAGYDWFLCNEEHLVDTLDSTCTCWDFMARCDYLGIWCKHLVAAHRAKQELENGEF